MKNVMKTLIAALFAVMLLATVASAQCGGMGGGMGMVPPEKQEAVKKIMDEYKDRFWALHQDLTAKHAELNAVMLQATPDTAKAKAISKELSAIKAQVNDLKIDMHTRIAKETGVRMPLGHGGSEGCGGGGMMGGGMMGGMAGHGQGMGMGMGGAQSQPHKM